MIAHVPGYLCAADLAQALHVPPKTVHQLASRYRWRKVKRPGHREVYYLYADVQQTPPRVLDKAA